MTVFGLPFLAGGLFAWSLLVLVPMELLEMDDRPTSTLGWVGFGIFIFLFGSIFTAIGGAIVWGGVRSILGFETHYDKRPKSFGKKTGALQTNDFRQHPNFPKIGKRQTGTRGRIRLHPEHGVVAGVFGMLVLTLFWNGFSWGVGYAVFREEGWSKGFLVPGIFLGIFCLVGVFIFFGFIHRVLRLLMVGKTFVESSVECAEIGQDLRFWLVQPGSFPITRAELALVCIEKYSYGAGSSRVTRTDEI